MAEENANDTAPSVGSLVVVEADDAADVVAETPADSDSVTDAVADALEINKMNRSQNRVVRAAYEAEVRLTVTATPTLLHMA